MNFLDFISGNFARSWVQPWVRTVVDFLYGTTAADRPATNPAALRQYYYSPHPHHFLSPATARSTSARSCRCRPSSPASDSFASAAKTLSVCRQASRRATSRRRPSRTMRSRHRGSFHSRGDDSGRRPASTTLCRVRKGGYGFQLG